MDSMGNKEWTSPSSLQNWHSKQILQKKEKSLSIAYPYNASSFLLFPPCQHPVSLPGKKSLPVYLPPPLEPIWLLACVCWDSCNTLSRSIDRTFIEDAFEHCTKKPNKGKLRRLKFSPASERGCIHAEEGESFVIHLPREAVFLQFAKKHSLY